MFGSEKLDKIFGEQEHVTSLVIAICATLFDNGVRIVHIGGLMRMLGVDNEQAAEHDDECFELGDDFYEQLEAMGFERVDVNSLQLNDTYH